MSIRAFFRALSVEMTRENTTVDSETGGTVELVDVELAKKDDAGTASSRPSFWLLVFGIFATFIPQTWAMEYLIKVRRFQATSCIAIPEFATTAILAVLVSRGGVPLQRSPRYRYSLVALSLTATRWLSYASMVFLSIPTANLFKSMKTIFVMLVGVFLRRKRFTALEYLAAVLISAAAYLFATGESKVDLDFHPIGIAIVLLSLITDAIMFNTQEGILRVPRSTQAEVLAYTNADSAALMLVAALASGEFLTASHHIIANPLDIVVMAFIATCGFFGVVCMTLLIRIHGAVRWSAKALLARMAAALVVAVIIGICRKVGTIIFSFILFPKPFASEYAVGLVIFVVGLAIEAREKRRRALS